MTLQVRSKWEPFTNNNHNKQLFNTNTRSKLEPFINNNYNKPKTMWTQKIRKVLLILERRTHTHTQTIDIGHFWDSFWHLFHFLVYTSNTASPFWDLFGFLKNEFHIGFQDEHFWFFQNAFWHLFGSSKCIMFRYLVVGISGIISVLTFCM